MIKFSNKSSAMTRRLSLAGLMVTVLSVAALAKAPKAHFLEPDAVDYKAILTTAPAEDSDLTRADLQTVLAWQAKRTDADIARAKSEVKMSPFVYADVLGSWFNPDDLPLTAKLLIGAAADGKAVSSVAKDYFGRRRPFLVDPRVKPVIEMESTPSFPSGHMTRATVWAHILAEIFPESKDDLFVRAKTIGDDRVLGGVHFPSDIEAGRQIGDAVFEKLMQNDHFKKDLAAAREEAVAQKRKHANDLPTTQPALPVQSPAAPATPMN